MLFLLLPFFFFCCLLYFIVVVVVVVAQYVRVLFLVMLTRWHPNVNVMAQLRRCSSTIIVILVAEISIYLILEEVKNLRKNLEAHMHSCYPWVYFMRPRK